MASVPNPSAPRLELVVARHQEDLAWLRRVPACWGVTVYDKGGQAQDLLEPLPSPRPARGERPAPRARVALPNVGREAHTYLHHIVARMAGGEPLADVTVLCQARPFDHAWDFHAALRGLADGSRALGEWLWLGHAIDTDTPDGALFRAWSKNPGGQGLDLDGFHLALTGRSGPGGYRFVLGGQLAARRALLERRGLAFWERALELSLSWPHAAHCFERMWDRALGAPGPSDALMAGRRTVYLKPMRGGAGEQGG